MVYLFFYLNMALATLVRAEPIKITQESLIEFSQSKQWLSYLQYYPDSQSRIEPNSKFFLSEKGAKDPLSELQASIHVFTDLTEQNQKQICQFPARYKMLQTFFKLAITTVNCPSLEEFDQQYSHQRVQIVFAGQYGASPGSVMGHTLLKFADDHKEDFLNYTFGYMADVPEDVGGLEYSYKGIFGGFKGYFVVGPYYEKVFEYNNIENRDVWEYELILTPEQNKFLIQYIYELRSTAEIKYFFAGRNCAYVLLAALQTVRPDKNLLEHLHFYVLPIETLKIVKQQGLLGTVRYRASQQRILTQRLARLSGLQKSEFDQALTDLNIGESTSVELIEALMDYVNFMRSRNAGELSKEWQSFESRLLVSRSKFTSTPTFQIETPTDVINGHRPFRIKTFTGLDEFKKSVIGVELRPGVHGLLENPVGFLPRSSLDFLATEFSKHEDQNWQINHVTIFDFALTPEFTTFFPEWTWQMKADWSRKVQSLDFQVGATFDVNQFFRVGALFDTLAQQSMDYDRYYRLLLGPAPFIQYNRPGMGLMQMTFQSLKEVVEGKTITGINFEGRLFNIFPHFSIEYSSDQFDTTSSDYKNEQSLGVVYDFSW